MAGQKLKWVYKCVSLKAQLYRQNIFGKKMEQKKDMGHRLQATTFFNNPLNTKSIGTWNYVMP